MSRWGLLAVVLGCRSPETPPVAPEPTTPPTTPRCGDGIAAPGEGCDDGNTFGGDGCLPDCTVEPQPIEDEPNDTWDAPDGYTAPVHAGLPSGDTDCFAVEVADCAAVSAAFTGDCPPDGVLALHDPSGVVIATGTLDAEGCARIDPVEAPGARFAAAGPHAVCVASLTGAAIDAYTLEISTEPAGGFPLSAADDPDADGQPAQCDDDDDGDAVADALDNCVDVPNGPGAEPLAPTASGFLVDWLALAPITGTVSPLDCLPSADELSTGDAWLAPRIGDPEGALSWVAWLGAGEIFDFLPQWGFVYAPREVYVHTYVYTATARDLTLAVGADDGVRVWLEGAVRLDVASCQGTWPDQFQAPASLVAGWNRLTLKVRDQGGGWSAAVRFLDAGVPVTDLALSLSPDPGWIPDQADLDGDGIGDVCDPTPAGG